MKNKSKPIRADGSLPATIKIKTLSDIEIKRLSRGLAPLSLRRLRTLTRYNLIEIILQREISFKNLRDDWNAAIKDNRVKDFFIERIKLLSDEDLMAGKIINLEQSLSFYKKKTHSLKAKNKLLREKLEMIDEDEEDEE